MKNKTMKIKKFSSLRNSKRISKKSQVSIEVNWLFVAIAGAIILIFFIGLVYRQRTVSETTLSGTLASDIEAILTGARVSTKTTESITTPAEITFICDAEGDSWFGIDWKRTGMKKDIPIDVVFAPDLIKEGELIPWALSFSAPFKVVNFLYLTSSQIRYIFVDIDDNDFATEIYYTLPEGMKKEHIASSNITNIQNLNNYKVKFIFFEDASGVAELPAFFQDIDVSAIQILSDSKQINFWKKQGTTLVKEAPSSYLTPEMLYGAIYAEDLTSYECNVKKAFKRFSLVTAVYAEREMELKNAYSGTDCGDIYWKTIADLNTTLYGCVPTNTCLTTSDTLSKIQEIERNNGALGLYSCPLLY